MGAGNLVMKGFVLWIIMGLFISTFAKDNMLVPAAEELQTVLNQNKDASLYLDHSLSNPQSGQLLIRDKVIHFYKNELKNNHDTPRILVEGFVKSGKNPAWLSSALLTEQFCYRFSIDYKRGEVRLWQSKLDEKNQENLKNCWRNIATINKSLLSWQDIISNTHPFRPELEEYLYALRLIFFCTVWTKENERHTFPFSIWGPVLLNENGISDEQIFLSEFAEHLENMCNCDKTKKLKLSLSEFQEKW